MARPRMGEIYLHKKSGHLYAVEGLGKLEKTLEDHVLYVRYDESHDAEPTLWIRPLVEFMDGRFELQSVVS